MTIVVANSALRTVWADTQMTSGASFRDYNGTKIERLHDGSIVGWAGSVVACLVVLDWLRAGAPTENAPEEWGDATVVRLMSDGAILYYEGRVPHLVRDSEFSIGSGAPYFKGARMAGANMTRAFEIVFALDGMCGGSIERLKLEGRARGKR